MVYENRFNGFSAECLAVETAEMILTISLHRAEATVLMGENKTSATNS